eukprot:CAMPEP_0194076120 /NCGR_PEP_ID=MMETSP0149-20130528/2988_1 /TAXON_ID=122233 /ORGANISM="Chaetoceros debilis, Strain MM31A-1" /LENGTH=212 /DNA_ID=CAMNT_0038756779 /DNA_START=27 /DNA_END=665 /DNA_ORIENTATION=-
MKLSIASVLTLATSASAFSISAPSTTRFAASKLQASATPYYMDEVVDIVTETKLEAPAPVQKKKPAKKVKKANPAHKEGIFSPAVYAAKAVMGENELKQFRAKAISMHTKVIGEFVGTHDSPVGNAVAKTLYSAIDTNGDGVLCENEVKEGMKTLGFSWIQEKQVKGIVKRADKDKNGTIDYDEFKNDLPKTLKTNLTKLAKKNGADLGFLV